MFELQRQVIFKSNYFLVKKKEIDIKGFVFKMLLNCSSTISFPKAMILLVDNKKSRPLEEFLRMFTGHSVTADQKCMVSGGKIGFSALYIAHVAEKIKCGVYWKIFMSLQRAILSSFRLQ